MNKRTSVSAVKDQAVFRNTAKRTVRINIAPNVSRGGIRL